MCRAVFWFSNHEVGNGKLFYFSQIGQRLDEDGTCGRVAVERGIIGRFPYPFEKTPQEVCRARMPGLFF